MLGNNKPPAACATDHKAAFGHEITLDGKTYCQINVHRIYNVSKHCTTSHESLVDRGANGGIAGNDVRIISKDAH